MQIYSLGKSDIWKPAGNLCVHISKLTYAYRGEEKFRHVSKMQKAIASIRGNKAEGTGRVSGNDPSCFCAICFSGIVEFLTYLISHAFKCIAENKLQESTLQTELVWKGLSNLNRSTPKP